MREFHEARRPDDGVAASRWSLSSSVRRRCARLLEDRPPAPDLRPEQGGEIDGAALVLGRRDAAERGQPLDHVGIVEALVERIDQTVGDRFRRALGAKMALQMLMR